MCVRPVRQVDPLDCKITSMTLVEHGRASKSGNTYIAQFNCDVRGILIKGCTLLRTEKNGIAVWMPQFHHENDPPTAPRRSVTVLEDSLRHTIMTKARDAYRALGGTLAEWTPRDAD